MKEPYPTLIAGVLLLFLSALVSGGMQSWRMDLKLSECLQLSPVELQAEQAGISVVRTEALRGMVEAGSHLILDARSLAEYDQGHLPDALSLPHDAFEETFPAFAGMLSPSDPLVVYCSGPLCDDALQVAIRLQEAGFEVVSVYIDGWAGWTR